MRVVIVPALGCQAAVAAIRSRAKVWARRTSAGKDDVFFCPTMDLLAMRAGQFVVLDLGLLPQALFDRLTGWRQFRGRRASDQDAFNNWSGFFFWGRGYHKFLSKPINDARFIDIIRRHFEFYPVPGCEANETFAHFSRDVREDETLVRQLNAEHCARENRDDFSLDLNRFPGIHEVDWPNQPRNLPGLVLRKNYRRPAN